MSFTESTTDVLADIKALPQWVIYNLVENGNRITKIPSDPKTGLCADASAPSTWGSYKQAQEAVQHYNYYGLGFEFGEKFKGYIGIDLDDVIDDNGNLNSFAFEIVNTVHSYTEYSPSGRGLHIICKSSKSMRELFGENVRHRDDKIGLEIYDSKRYFTVTERYYGTPKPIQECTEQIKAIYKKYLDQQVTLSENIKDCINPTTSLMPLESSNADQILLQKIFSSKNGNTIQELFNGNASGYVSHSEADMALVNHLAYWSNGNAEQIDRIFRQSKLMRSKWDRGNPTYGNRTIAKVLNNLAPNSTAAVSVVENPPAIQPLVNWEEENTLAYLKDGLHNDLERSRVYSHLKTGYNNIDTKTSLYPGLYLLGATSSLGKTTFMCQMSNQLALAGQPVLYFTLEQSRFELVLKGLSRLTVKKFGQSIIGISAMEIREKGVQTADIADAIAKYENFAKNETFIECRFDSIDNIQRHIEDYIVQNKVRPVVIIDYMQIIRAIDNNRTAKDAVDNNVRILKKLQIENELVMLLISSLNRQSYLSPIDFESFKESGGLEYTADVIWGLQLQVLHDDIFSKRESVTQKRNAVNMAKIAHPRKIEFVCLKNRFGVSNFSCYFDYYSQFERFVPVIAPQSQTSTGSSLRPVI